MYAKRHMISNKGNFQILMTITNAEIAKKKKAKTLKLKPKQGTYLCGYEQFV